MSETRDTPGTPDFYDDLDALIGAGEALMACGGADRTSPAHTPTLATVGLDGAPRLRTVVLRDFDGGARTARVHSDIRAAKIAEIAADPRVALHAYDADRKLQVRLSGRAAVHGGDDVAHDLWRRMKTFSKRCYFAAPDPGTAVEGPISGLEGLAASGEASSEADAEAFTHFAAVVIAYAALEVLYLHADGHRRARVTWVADRRIAAWLVP